MDLPGRSVGSRAVQRDVVEFTNQLWGEHRGVAHSLLPTPVSLSVDDIETLRAQQYAWSWKTDGVRYQLLLTTNDKGENEAFCIDRKQTVRRLRNDRISPRETVQAPAFLAVGNIQIDVYEGSVIDVEYTGCGRWTVLDVVAVGGYSLRNVLSFKDRIGIVDLLWGDDSFVSNKEWFPMATAPSVDPTQYPTEQDGIIFMPVRGPIRTGLHANMFKLKWHHTVDLLWKDGAWRWVRNGMLQPVPYDVQVDAPRCAIDRPGVYELAIDAAPDAIEPGEIPRLDVSVVIQRHDKSVPNEFHTVQAAVRDTKSPITPGDIWGR
ncbi:MAG: hypothetical protein CL902_00730 [Dehalococcoidia bacterium]|nr:hypothetical protein [Dehalococcoidia bacterium]